MIKHDKTSLEETSIIDQSLIAKLPAPLQRGVGAFNTAFERELFLYGALTVSSGLFNTAKGKYFQRDVLPNLFLLAISGAASGKGALLYAKKLPKRVHEHFLQDSTEKLRQYNAALKEYTALKKKDSNALPPERPPFRVVNIPGNCSASRMLQHLADNQNGAVPNILLESEIDSLTTNGMSDWPAVDEMLRKAYHNEPITWSRKTNQEYFEINNPSLAVALSGTRDQLFRLITSAENGTYSRFTILQSSQEPNWVDVRPCESCTSLSDLFEELSEEFYRIWKYMDATPFEFLFHDNQWDKLNEYCAWKLKEVLQIQGEAATSLVKRHGLHLFKLAMTLTCFRRFEWEDRDSQTYCLDNDFDVALTLTDYSLQHSLDLFQMLPGTTGNRKSQHKEKFLTALPETFDRKQALAIGSEMGVSERSVDRYLKGFVEKGVIQQIGPGEYQKP